MTASTVSTTLFVAVIVLLGRGWMLTRQYNNELRILGFIVAMSYLVSSGTQYDVAAFSPAVFLLYMLCATDVVLSSRRIILVMEDQITMHRTSSSRLSQLESALTTKIKTLKRLRVMFLLWCVWHVTYRSLTIQYSHSTVMLCCGLWAADVLFWSALLFIYRPQPLLFIFTFLRETFTVPFYNTVDAPPLVDNDDDHTIHMSFENKMVVIVNPSAPCDNQNDNNTMNADNQINTMNVDNQLDNNTMNLDNQNANNTMNADNQNENNTMNVDNQNDNNTIDINTMARMKLALGW
eukprot:CAMPEP_0113844726 /NCGR_PEP_ID=MMETSP0372-20130328/385_1 /TAXON_ID=340204 /ORGANISM="Lankesteria abbotti" /LENGTH=292 /DNA_ID=CAMNT_0000813737 /DNA_START=233 /DNA_END=1108 /DNA_ORIENTATION=- /assembly_acc=CAM_ASM_000359